MEEASNNLSVDTYTWLLSQSRHLHLVAFLLVSGLNCHLSLVLSSVVQGDAVNCNKCQMVPDKEPGRKAISPSQ